MKEYSGQVAKVDVVNAVLKYLMRKNFTSIAADKSNFHKPPLVQSSTKNISHRPDFTANREGTMHVFEIETDQENFKEEATLDKWKLLSSYASGKGGEFYLVILAEHEKQITEVLKNARIDAGILQVAPK